MQERETHQPEGKKTTNRRWNHQCEANRMNVELPDLSDFEMIIFDIDGTLLDNEGLLSE